MNDDPKKPEIRANKQGKEERRRERQVRLVTICSGVQLYGRPGSPRGSSSD